jgi:hypothetical protein
MKNSASRTRLTSLFRYSIKSVIKLKDSGVLKENISAGIRIRKKKTVKYYQLRVTSNTIKELPPLEHHLRTAIYDCCRNIERFDSG